MKRPGERVAPAQRARAARRARPNPRPAWPLWAAANLITLTAVGLIWWRFAPTPEAPTAPALSLPDLDEAREDICAQRDQLASNLTTALSSQDESTVSGLVALQVQSSDLSLKDMRWAPLPRKGGLVPVELTLKVEGSYYNLPILIDGMYHQARPLEITHVEVETPRPMAAYTFTTIRARFWRPPPLSTAWLREQAADAEVFQGEDPALAEAVLVCAAEAELLERFLEVSPALVTRSQSNKAALTRALPGMIRKLPTSSMGWIALTLKGDELVLVTEPTDL